MPLKQKGIAELFRATSASRAPPANVAHSVASANGDRSTVVSNGEMELRLEFLSPAHGKVDPQDSQQVDALLEMGTPSPSTLAGAHKPCGTEVAACSLQTTSPPSTNTTQVQKDTAQLVVVSWNTGGFVKTHKMITSHYGSFGKFMQRHGADVMCIQETKMLPCWLKDAAEAKKHGAIVDGYRSFWAFNQLKGKSSGFNGVATWVREGIAAVSGAAATQNVLGNDLDLEGRCLLVDLGGLVVLNVYAPRIDPEDKDNRDTVIEKKDNFLRLLWARSQELQRAGKRVVICGDLNLTWRPNDCKISRRCVEVVAGCIGGRSEWPVEAADGSWLPVADVVKSLRVSCSAPVEHVEARLHSMSKELLVLDKFLLGGREIEPGRVLLTVNGTVVTNLEEVVQELQIGTVAMLEFGVKECDIAKFGQTPHTVRERKCVEALTTVLEAEDGFVDTFAVVHSTAVDRFTCWNQHLNLRYSNTGNRLDYILCDLIVAKALVATATAELAGACDKFAGHTREAAMNAATCFGRWHGAPRKALLDGEAGLSLQEGNMELNDTQFRTPHTGMLYTPPSYSDHVPVSALFRGGDFLIGVVHVGDKETKCCTPWVKQPGLASFFSKGTKRPRDDAS